METYSSEFLSEEYIHLNSCGMQKIYEYDLGSFRPNGRIDYHIIYVSEGCCFVNLGNETIEAKEGSVIIYLPGQKQHYKYYKRIKSTSYYLHFSGTGCEKIFVDLNLNKQNIYYVGKSITLEKLLNSLISEFQRNTNYNQYLIQGILIQIIATIGRSNNNLCSSTVPNNVYKRLLEFLNKNIDKTPSIEECAKFCNLSESRFSHQFSQIMGMSPKKYILNLKIQTAKELLSFSDLSILQISNSIGITDQNYFSRIFKKQTGYSPNEYRKLN